MKLQIQINDGVIQPTAVPDFKDGLYEIEINNLDTRTLKQNRAYHMWLTMIANRLNAENITTQQVLKPNIHWDGEKVKQMFTRPLIKVMFGVNTSAKLKKGDFDTLINTMTKAFGERGVQLPDFPSIENLKGE